MIQQISDAELEVMKIVWGNRSEVTLFPYIMDGLAARGKPCQKNTLIVLLSRLMNKGFLSAKKVGRRNEYTTLVSETEYQTAQTKNFLDKIYEGSAKGLVSNLILGDLLAKGKCNNERSFKNFPVYVLFRRIAYYGSAFGKTVFER